MGISYQQEDVMNPEDHLEIIRVVVRSRCRHLFKIWEYDELVNMGYFGLVDACQKYDHSKNIKFITYASIRIYGSIIDEIRSNNWFGGDKRSRHTRDPHLISHYMVDLDLLHRGGVRAHIANYDDYLQRRRIKERFKRKIRDKLNIIKPHPDYEILDLLEDALKEELPEREVDIMTSYYLQRESMKSIGERYSVTESRICQVLQICMGILKKARLDKLRWLHFHREG